jgi:hypothetical protein
MENKTRIIDYMLYFFRVTLPKMVDYQWMPACDMIGSNMPVF